MCWGRPFFSNSLPLGRNWCYLKCCRTLGSRIESQLICKDFSPPTTAEEQTATATNCRPYPFWGHCLVNKPRYLGVLEHFSQFLNCLSEMDFLFHLFCSFMMNFFYDKNQKQLVNMEEIMGIGTYGPFSG